MAILTTDKVKQLLAEGNSGSEIAKTFKLTRQAVYHHIEKLKKQRKKKIKSAKRKFLINWRVYNEGLVKWGEILLDIGSLKEWQKELSFMNENKSGRPYLYPESFILFLMRLKPCFKIDYRSLEGISRRLILFISSKLRAPDILLYS